MLTPDQQVDKICDQFEKALRAGERVEISDFLQRIAAEHREILFAQLLLVQEDLLQDTVDANTSEARSPEYDLVMNRLLQGGENNSESHDGNDPRFQVIRPHARGGLGEVFVAKDQELNREVALKEIQERFADHPESRSRFVLEAEVTGGLEHPGIVPVYGLGQYSDGRPYYAMRFIKGDSLKDAIKSFHQNRSHSNSERALELRKLLGRFVDVCQAISYAHSRGVLHRDLKPSNIMLGKYGETLVVDWGLARIGDRDQAPEIPEEETLAPYSGSVTPTVAGSAMGTPAYMPPEQAAGRLTELGPASDVYSLGATLYHLLTGSSPFGGKDVQTTLKNVQAGSFTPPRVRNAQIPKALEAVCLKAMSLKPADRYQSAIALANDIERILADEPIDVLREPFVQRARRWVRKHPTFSATTSAAVLISAISAVAFSSLVAGKNRELENTNAALIAANGRETQQRELAQANEKTAKEQSQLALETLTSVISDLQRSLEDVAGGAEVRRRLLNTSLEQFQQLSSKYVDQASADHQTIIALVEMGSVVLELGGGEQDAQESPAQETAEQETASQLALQFFTRARDLAQSMVDMDAGNFQARMQLSACHDRIGEVLMLSGESSEAFQSFQKSLALRQSLASEDPESVRIQNSVADVFEKIGFARLGISDLPAALGAYKEALQIRESIATSSSYQQSRIARAHYGIGNVLIRTGDSASAVESLQKSVEIYRSLARSDPDAVSIRTSLAMNLDVLGNAQQAFGDSSSALAAYESGMEIRQQLVSADPNNHRLQNELAVSHSSLGRFWHASGDYALALKSHQKALEIRQALVQADPKNTDAQLNLSISNVNIGKTLLKAKGTESALEFFEDALQIRQKLVASDPDNVRFRLNLSFTLAMIGDARRQAGDSKAAQESYQKALEIFESLASENPTDVELQENLSLSHSNIGFVQIRLGAFAAALESYQNALKICQSRVLTEPGNVGFQNGLAKTHASLGFVHEARGEYQQSIQAFEQSIAILNRMIRNGQNVQGSKRELAKVRKDASLVRHTAIAMGDLANVLKQPAKQIPKLLEVRAIRLAKQRKFVLATQAASKLRQQEHSKYGNFYNAGCIFSIAAASVVPAEGKQLSDEQKRQRGRWIKQAIASLEQSVDAGWKDFGLMRNDKDLKILHDVPAFKAILNREKK